MKAWVLFFKSWFFLLYLVYQGSLNFIIYFCFPISEELLVCFSYCFISINYILLVVKCYSSLRVSGFSRNGFNSGMQILIFILCLFFTICC